MVEKLIEAMAGRIGALVAAALLLGCCSAASLQGAVYNETLAKKGAVWSSIAYGPPVRVYGRGRHVWID